MANPQRLSPLERLLRLVTDVRTGEGKTALLLALNVFLILTAYSVIKPVRDALILAGGGAEIKSYSSAGQAILLLIAVPVYGILANKMPRRRLINVVTTFFAASFGAFFVAGQLAIAPLAVSIAFYFWIGIFSVMVIAQIWSFANDIYTIEEGERLFPIVMLGASIGGVIGAFVAGPIIRMVDVYQPLIVGAILLMLSLVITNYIDARERRRREADLPHALTTESLPAASQEIPMDEIRKALTGELAVDDVVKTMTGELRLEDIRRAIEEERPPEPPIDAKEKMQEGLKDIHLGGEEGPFRMVIRSRYLLMIAFLTLLLNWVNTTGGYILDSVVEDVAAAAVAAGQAGGLSEREYIASFFSTFNGVVNLLALITQLFIVSRVIKYLGVRIGLIALPLISLSAYSLIALFPLLPVVRAGKTGENATDYSLQNTVRNILFLPTTREEKYKAKQAIDTFFHRAGDLLQAVVVFIGTTYLAMQARDFALFNIGLVVVWLILAVLIGREYRRLVAARQQTR